MTLGYQLFIALLLLLPGIVGWVCVRAGSTDDLLSPMPDRQGSTTTLAAIVLFACLGHLLAAMAIDLNSRVAATWTLLSYDPDFYRVILSPTTEARNAHDIWTALSGLLWTSFVTGALCYWLGRKGALQNLVKPSAAGWLQRVVDASAASDKVALAYVMTKAEHEGNFVAYEGVVEAISLDEDQCVGMITMSKVDRFLVTVDAKGVHRQAPAAKDVIAILRLRKDEIANIAFDTLDVASDTVETFFKLRWTERVKRAWKTYGETELHSDLTYINTKSCLML